MENDTGSNNTKLLFVPEDLKTAEICLAAIRENKPIQFVPEGLKNADLCAAAIRENEPIQFVPEDFKNADLCTAAILASDLKSAAENLGRAVDQFNNASSGDKPKHIISTSIVMTRKAQVLENKGLEYAQKFADHGEPVLTSIENACSIVKSLLVEEHSHQARAEKISDFKQALTGLDECLAAAQGIEITGPKM